MAALAAGPAGTVTTAGAEGGPCARQVTNRSRPRPGRPRRFMGFSVWSRTGGSI